MRAIVALGGAVSVGLIAAGAAAQEPRGRLDTLADISAALRACWVAPRLESSRPSMQITVMMSFKRDGELFGRPRITFETAGASDEERLAYRVAVAKMLRRCTPLAFTDALGNAVAGRPFTVRFVVDRKLKQAESVSWPATKTR